jgi:hypothetical protein
MAPHQPESSQPRRAPAFSGWWCSFVTKGLPANETFLSLRRLSRPQIATYTAGYRVVFDIDRATARKTMRFVPGLPFVGRGRGEITLITAAPYAAREPVVQSEIRIACELVVRIPDAV